MATPLTMANRSLLFAPSTATAQATHLLCEMTGTLTGNRYKKDLAIDLMRREVIEDGTTHTPLGTWQTNAEIGIAWHYLFVSASETEIVWKTSVYKGGVIDSPDFYVARMNCVSGTLSTGWASGQCRRIEAKDRVL